MTNDQVKEIALANGFKLKDQPDGTQDLNPYVYEFARALLGSAVKNNRERAFEPLDFMGNPFTHK